VETRCAVEVAASRIGTDKRAKGCRDIGEARETDICDSDSVATTWQYHREKKKTEGESHRSPPAENDPNGVGTLKTLSEGSDI
jgi:hypothetical protein